MLADIDDPPKSRVPGLLIGFAVALPIAGVFWLWLIPLFVGSILGGARELDDRLRANDAYVQELCGAAYDGDRDAELCNCVWSMNFPSLDCRPEISAWSLRMQANACTDTQTRDASLRFCTCIDTIGEKVAASASDVEARGESLAYERCETLEDAVELPTVEELASGRN